MLYSDFVFISLIPDVDASNLPRCARKNNQTFNTVKYTLRYIRLNEQDYTCPCHKNKRFIVYRGFISFFNLANKQQVRILIHS